MPTIFEPGELHEMDKDHMKVTTLADQAMLGTNALQVERVLLEANAKSSIYGPVDAERFLYVIHGKGRTNVGEQVFPLEPESVLWLEKYETFTLEAAGSDLEVLLCQAPAMD